MGKSIPLFQTEQQFAKRLFQTFYSANCSTSSSATLCLECDSAMERATRKFAKPDLDGA